MSKSIRKQHKRERQRKHQPTESLRQLDADFAGRIAPESIRNRRYVLVIVCPKSKLLFTFPIRHKSEYTDEVRKLLLYLRAKCGNVLAKEVVRFFRSDNGHVWGGECGAMILDRGLLGLRPPPYHPQASEIAGAFVKLLSRGLRSMLSGADLLLWCCAAEFFSLVWNHTPTKPDWLSPIERVALEKKELNSRQLQSNSILQNETSEDRPPALPYKRFGCLCVRLSTQPECKWDTKWKPGAYLGQDPQIPNPIVGLSDNGVFCERRELSVRTLEDVLASK